MSRTPFFNYRARAIGAAIFLVPCLLWMSFSFRNRPELLDTQNITATVQQVHNQNLKDPAGTAIYAVDFVLSDGQKISLKLREPIPRRGEEVPFKRQRVKTGKHIETEYNFDRLLWENGIQN